MIMYLKYIRTAEGGFVVKFRFILTEWGVVYNKCLTSAGAIINICIWVSFKILLKGKNKVKCEIYTDFETVLLSRYYCQSCHRIFLYCGN